jgi:hypothetical protein
MYMEIEKRRHQMMKTSNGVRDLKGSFNGRKMAPNSILPNQKALGSNYTHAPKRIAHSYVYRAVDLINVLARLLCN